MQHLSIGILEKRRDAKIKELMNLGPVLQGSISTIKVTCGKATCKCSQGEKHISNILTKKVNGKTKSLYVPNDMVAEAKQWINENRKLRELQKEISNYNEQILKKYVKTQRAKKKNLEILNQVASNNQRQ